MAKLMQKHGDTTPVYYDEYLFKQDPSAYEILDAEPEEPVVRRRRTKAEEPAEDPPAD